MVSGLGIGHSKAGNPNNVSGGGSSTDNAVPRWDGTAGTTLQDSGVLIDDSDNITGVGNIAADSFTLNAAAELTIASGSVTRTQESHKIDTQDNDVSDDLTDIAGGSDGDRIIIRAINSNRTVVVKSNAGTGTADMQLQGKADFSLDSGVDVMGLIHNGTRWIEQWRSNNNSAETDNTHIHADEAGFNFIIDGGGSEIATGIKGDIEVPFAFTVSAVRMLADQSGSIVVDIWKQAYADYPPEDANSVTASAVPTISTDVKSEDTTLTGWTTAFSKGDTLRYNVDSVTTIERVTVSLTGAKTTVIGS